jgi:hypothetical protein
VKTNQRDIDNPKKRDAAENKFEFSEEDINKFTDRVS